MNLSHYPRLISHRGANLLAAENTIKAFEIAAQQGAQWIEFDVCLAKDGTPVLFHDDNMQRMTGLDSQISQHSYSELREIPLLHKGSPEGQIATLGQALAFCKDNNIACNIELKPQSPEEAMPLAETVTDWLEGYDGYCVVSSFSAECLLHFKQCSNRPIAALAPKLPEEWRDIIGLLNPVAIHLDDSIADWPTVRILRTVNLPIAVWTVNSPERLQQLLAYGACSIFTDDLTLFTKGMAQSKAASGYQPLVLEK